MLSENHCSIDRRQLVDGISFVCEKKRGKRRIMGDKEDRRQQNTHIQSTGKGGTKENKVLCSHIQSFFNCYMGFWGD